MKQLTPLEIEIAPARETKVGDTITSNDFQLGDTVRFLEPTSPWSAYTVIGITKSTARLYRPYVQLADFSMTHTYAPYTNHAEHGLGVIPYIGIEDHVFDRRDSDAWVLLDRVKNLK